MSHDTITLEPDQGSARAVRRIEAVGDGIVELSEHCWRGVGGALRRIYTVYVLGRGSPQFRAQNEDYSKASGTYDDVVKGLRKAGA